MYCDWSNTVNLLMFAWITVCIFETKPCSRGLICAVKSGLANYLGMFAGYLLLRFEDGCKFYQINPSQTLMNLQYWASTDWCR